MLEKTPTASPFHHLTAFWCSLVLKQLATASKGAAVIWEEDMLRADGGQLWYFRKRPEPQCSDIDSIFPKLQRFLKFGFRFNSSDFAFSKTQRLVFTECVGLVWIFGGGCMQSVGSTTGSFLLLPHPLRKCLLMLIDLTSITECDTGVSREGKDR